MNTRKYHRTLLVSAALLIISYGFWMAGRNPDVAHHALLSKLGLWIQAGLVVGWLHFARKRILHPQISRYLTGICTLMLFWFGARYVRWFWCSDNVLSLYLWYLYYLPIIFIPFLVLLSSLMMGRNEGYRFPKWVSVFYTCGCLLFLLVFTNNYHYLAFDLTNDIPDKPSSVYTYGPAFYAVMVWCICCVLGAIVCLCRKFRFLKKRQVLILSAIFLFDCMYAAGYSGKRWHDFVHAYMADMTSVYCFSYILLFECCLAFRLITSNFGYENLFLAGELYMAVENTKEQMLICSADFPLISKEELEKTKERPIIVDDIYRISSLPIRDGRVYWREDVSELLETIRELQDMKLELQGDNALAQKELELKQKETAIAELQKIYDRIEQETNDQIRTLSRLLEQYDGADTEALRRSLLYQMVVIGAYLKRRNNMILLSGSGAGDISSMELELCFRESLQAMEISGVVTHVQMDLPDRIPFYSAALLYDHFERVVEAAIPDLHAMMVNIQCPDEEITMLINTDSAGDLSVLALCPDGEIKICRDEEEWQFSLHLRGGGGV